MTNNIYEKKTFNLNWIGMNLSLSLECDLPYGRYLEWELRGLGVSRRSFAQRAGFSPRTIYRICKGECEPRGTTREVLDQTLRNLKIKDKRISRI